MEKARTSKRLWDEYKRDSNTKEDEAEHEIRIWAMEKDE